jgi:hypothetical protein
MGALTVIGTVLAVIFMVLMPTLFFFWIVRSATTV